jgi:hypothetical protein
MTKAHLAEVVSLYETNYRDPVATSLVDHGQ